MVNKQLKPFVIYMTDGTFRVVHGEDIGDALKREGIIDGPHIDSYTEGAKPYYKYCPIMKRWDYITEPLHENRHRSHQRGPRNT